MKTLNTTKVIAACALIYWSTASFSHIVLENKSAVAGSAYKAVFQVGHGCNGSATTSIAVQIPTDFQAAKPYPKTGWAIAIEPNKLVTWTATSQDAALQNAHFDEFVLRGKLPDAAGPMWFKVVQTCQDGVNSWTQIPATGTSIQGIKSPAVLLAITAADKPVNTVITEHKH